PLRGALQLDERAAVVHDHVHVRFGFRIFRVIQIEHGYAGPNTDRYRRDLTVNGAFSKYSLPDERRDRIAECNVTAGDRCRARAPIGLQDIAIKRDGALTKRLEVDDGAQCAPDQPLNLQRTSALLTARGLTSAARVCRTGQHP